MSEEKLTFGKGKKEVINWLRKAKKRIDKEIDWKDRKVAVFAVHPKIAAQLDAKVLTTTATLAATDSLIDGCPVMVISSATDKQLAFYGNPDKIIDAIHSTKGHNVRS